MRLYAIAALALVAAGCSPGMRREPAVPAVQTARAQLRNAEGRLVGEVRLRQLPEGVLVSGELTNVPPGEHGIHLHETGACTPTFEAAGGHFSPEPREHGFESPGGPHAGDLPNIYVPESGVLRFDYVNPRVNLSGARGLLDADGAAVVIHAYADDYETDPSGDSGPRIACGVVAP